MSYFNLIQKTQTHIWTKNKQTLKKFFFHYFIRFWWYPDSSVRRNLSVLCFSCFIYKVFKKTDTWCIQWAIRLFVQAFKIVVDFWTFSMLLLYILWDDWPMVMISSLNEQLQKELEYTLLKPDWHSWWISKMQSGHEDHLEERYAIKFCFELGKNAMRWKLDLMLWPRDQEKDFSVEACWLFQTQEGQTEQIYPQTFDETFFDRTGMIYMHWVPTGQTVNKEYYAEDFREFRKRFPGKRPALFKSGQRYFHQDNAPVHNSIFITDYWTKMGINTVPQPLRSLDLGPCEFCLFSNLRGCCYETTEEMKEAVIFTLTQEDFHGAFQMLEWYKKCIAARGDYFKRTRASRVYYQ